MSFPSKSESIKAIATALHAVQNVMESAKKDSANPYFKSKYADLAAIQDVTRKPMFDNGLSITQLPGKDELGHYLETVLLHNSGEFLCSRMYITPIKDDPQALGSAITYARRYSQASVLNVATEDDDGEGGMGRSHRPNAATPPAKPQNTPEDSQGTPVETLPWRKTVWHLLAGSGLNQTYDFKGQTLGQIHAKDPESFAYWVRTYKPSPKSTPKDHGLRKALDEAKEELAKLEAEAPKEEDVPQDTPKTNKENLLEQVQELCRVNNVQPGLILEKAKEKNRVPKNAKFIDAFDEELLVQAIENFNFFIKLARKSEAA